MASFSSSQVTAVSQQHNTSQLAEAGSQQQATNKPEPVAKKLLVTYQVNLCPRSADNPYDHVSFGQQLQHQRPWLARVSNCLDRLGSSANQLQSEGLRIPWAWLARDLIQLLPTSSCYSHFLEDDDLFCQFLQQLTSDNLDNLSEPGAKLMAGILNQLAKQDPIALAEYTEASPAVLQRITEVCSTLCRANRSSHAAECAVGVLGCLLIRHKASVHNHSKQAMKKVLHVLLLLPANLQNAACTKLMQPHQSFHPLFLRMKEVPEPLQHCQVSLAVDSLERRSKSSKEISQTEASSICKWAIWATAPVHHNQLLVKMVELAVLAHHLLRQGKNAWPNVTAVGSVQQYIELMRQTCQPDRLNSVLAGAQDQNGHAVQLVRWVASLYLVVQQNTDPAASGISNHQMYSYLLGVKNSIQTNAVSMPQLLQALHKLHPGTDSHGQPSTKMTDRRELNASEPPAAATRKGELTFNDDLAPREAAAMKFVLSLLMH